MPCVPFLCLLAGCGPAIVYSLVYGLPVSVYKNVKTGKESRAVKCHLLLLIPLLGPTLALKYINPAATIIKC